MEKRLTVILPPDMYTRIVARCEPTGMSISTLIREAIIEKLDRDRAARPTPEVDPVAPVATR